MNALFSAGDCKGTPIIHHGAFDRGVQLYKAGAKGAAITVLHHAADIHTKVRIVGKIRGNGVGRRVDHADGGTAVGLLRCGRSCQGGGRKQHKEEQGENKD
ncbi:MAG: hypothetical protein RR614_11035 [Eubacterium sp.]